MKARSKLELALGAMLVVGAMSLAGCARHEVGYAGDDGYYYYGNDYPAYDDGGYGWYGFWGGDEDFDGHGHDWHHGGDWHGGHGDFHGDGGHHGGGGSHGGGHGGGGHGGGGGGHH